MNIIAIILLALVAIALVIYAWDFGNTIEDIMTQLEAVTDELNSIEDKLEDVVLILNDENNPCNTCKYRDLDASDEVCQSCECYSHWEADPNSYEDHIDHMIALYYGMPCSDASTEGNTAIAASSYDDEDYMDPSEYCEPEDYCDPLAITASSSDDDEDLLF